MTMKQRKREHLNTQVWNMYELFNTLIGTKKKNEKEHRKNFEN